VDVYIDNFIGLAIPNTKQQLNHVANRVMCGLYDIFPPPDDAREDPISRKKMSHGILLKGSWVLDSIGLIRPCGQKKENGTP
jgi:hypothetical protein